MSDEGATRRPETPSNEAGNRNLWSEYEIEALTSLVDRPLRHLKHGDAFAVLDTFGDVGSSENTAEGLYYRDTRYLSRFELRIEGKRPLLLSSAALEDKAALAVDLSNPDVVLGPHDKLPRDTIYLERTKFIWKAVCYERIKVKNYGPLERTIRLDVLFDADFHDMFEVRGTGRARRGRDSARVLAADKTELGYSGLDGIKRRTILHLSPKPKRLEAHRATWQVTLVPSAHMSLFITIIFEEDEPTPVSDFFIAYRDAHRARRIATAGAASVTSSSEVFNEVSSRAASDAYTLITRTDLGPYPFAGIPWFSTVFGRDGIVTAMLMLWMDASIARGVLRTLAATQATDFDPASDAQPGKILHEMRHGEMANLGEVPFRRYYGSVDATPLFLMLAGMYFERTGDQDTIEAIWSNIEAALYWIDTSGDRDGDGFVEYYRETESGLVNQGWKDSYDAIFHVDGSTATGAIALCEVQAYVIAGKRAVASIAERFGRDEFAARLRAEAENLRRHFEEQFWCEELGMYAMALDGAKRPCRVRASNAGHALFAGAAAPERARRVAASLMTPEAFSGWGIRTVAHGEVRFNPMSYHNGSVWPHDNALTGIGFARYGLKREAVAVFDGLFAAATYQEMRRLPELFCGFNRRPRRGPTAYPVACAPQAWAATSLFGLLAACLGLELVQDEKEIRFRDPMMPSGIDDIVIRNLRLGDARVDVRLHRYGDDVTANVLGRQGSARVLVLK
jgi:glycogen debranching enzyme